MKIANIIRIFFALILALTASARFAAESDPNALISSLDRKSIPVYKTVVPKEGTFGVHFQEEVARLSNLTFVKLLKSANFGFEGDPVAYEIKTEKEIKGWVSLDQVWFPAKVIGIKTGDTLNIRASESLDSKIVDRVRSDEIFYVNAIVLIHLGYKGYDPVDWARVSTKRGNHGFVRLRYFEIANISVDRYP
ncbi:hypothetical protein JWG45_21180 [Leptospira sp. 201903070]|jgi:hypothetical protein|uniref:SH3 domain-containing protein n=1 Tax=Leptospira ainlahdjerensis TaxID=2810033 RepID=A0ABS2UK44_9LEPT|nr:SH3 domain-containing protein [Leptospira ainlahdjerensis]MBM9579665.1 hypothetical protein [Leptospira ainlahdjerensis]